MVIFLLSRMRHYALQNSGGVIIVEAGTYNIGSSDTINVYDNTTIIGRGNAVIEVAADVSAFKNANLTNGNERITISGFHSFHNRTNHLFSLFFV